jgi:hypothetical protein
MGGALAAAHNPPQDIWRIGPNPRTAPHARTGRFVCPPCRRVQGVEADCDRPVPACLVTAASLFWIMFRLLEQLPSLLCAPGMTTDHPVVSSAVSSLGMLSMG